MEIEDTERNITRLGMSANWKQSSGLFCDRGNGQCRRLEPIKVPQASDARLGANWSQKESAKLEDTRLRENLNGEYELCFGIQLDSHSNLVPDSNSSSNQAPNPNPRLNPDSKLELKLELDGCKQA